jgi:hypothetical protein
MYRSALLVALVNCGLVEALVDLGKEQVEELQDVSVNIQSGASSGNLGLGFKATILLGDLLQMSPTLLPRVQVARLQVRSRHSAGCVVHHLTH